MPRKKVTSSTSRGARSRRTNTGASGQGKPAPELVFGLVGAVGTDLDAVRDALETSLARFGYSSQRIRVSDLMREFEAGALEQLPADQRIKQGMVRGTEFRKKVGKGDALVGLIVERIVRLRGSQTPRESQAYIIRSLKNPAEVHRLRRIYRDHFLCVGVYSPRSTRVASLADQIAYSRGGRASDYRASAEELVQRDEKELGTKLGQDVRDAFPLADFFVNSADVNRLDGAIERFLDLLFGHPFLTPTRDEFGMFHARAAALRSAALSRQVGASICNDAGDLVALGMNEVPKATGGHYWTDDVNDTRDFKRGHDQNDRTKETIVLEIFAQLKAEGWLSRSYQSKSTEELARRSAQSGLLKDTILSGLTEFGREVHAEMSAITAAARLGVSTRGNAMYVTTFPCHNCAKHIIASGICRVVYIEPYPKSFAAEFHSDSLAMDADAKTSDDSVGLQPFQGVAPRRYMQWFQWDNRKEGGLAVPWAASKAVPRFLELGQFDESYRDREDEHLAEFGKDLRKFGLQAR